MSTAQFIALMPYIILTAFALLVIVVIPFKRNHTLIASLSITGLSIAFISLFFSVGSLPQTITSLLYVNGMTQYFAGLLIAATIAIGLMVYNYMELNKVDHREEVYLLLMLAALGSSVLAASRHFASLFLGLEILTVSLYGLIAYLRDEKRCIEAGIKYLILASVSTAFLLFGMALLYADTGTMQLNTLSEAIVEGNIQGNVIFVVGLALILIGVGFKLALVPFHLWTPDVYQGAPAPISAFVATVSKGGMFAVVIAFFAPMKMADFSSLYLAFILIAVVSMFVGNWLALMQKNVKRILAFSSIAHLGYLLVAIIAMERIAITAGLFYITAYMVTTLIAFGIISILSTQNHEAEELSEYHGLFWRRPWLAGIFTFALLSLAGIPLTGGFIGKFYLIAAGVGSTEWLLVFSVVLSSSIGLFYYLRIIVTMISQTNEAVNIGKGHLPIPWSSSYVLAFLSILLLWMGILPANLVSWIHSLL